MFSAVKLPAASAQGCSHHALVSVVTQSVFASKPGTVWIKGELTKINVTI